MARNRRESVIKHSSFKAYLESIVNVEPEPKLEVIEKLINGFGERLLAAVTQKQLTISDSIEASAISKEISELMSELKDFQSKKLELIRLKKIKDTVPDGNRKYLKGVGAILEMYTKIKKGTDSIDEQIKGADFSPNGTKTFSNTFFTDIIQSFDKEKSVYSGFASLPFFISKDELKQQKQTTASLTHVGFIIDRFNLLVSNMEYGDPISKFFNYVFSTLYITTFAIRRAFLALSWNLYDELMKKIDFSSEDTQQSIVATILVGILRTILKPVIFLALIVSGLTSVISMAAEAVSFVFNKIASETSKVLSNAFSWLINFFIGDRTLVSESSDANSKIQPDKDLIEELTGSNKEDLVEVYKNSTSVLKEQMNGILERPAEEGIGMLDEKIKQYKKDESRIVYTGLIREVTALRNCITPAQELKVEISPSSLSSLSSLKPEELILKATAIEEKIAELDAKINTLNEAMKDDNPEYLTQIHMELNILIENARKSKSIIEAAIKVQSLISIPPLLQSVRQELSAIDIALEHEKRAKEMEDALNNLQEAAKKYDIPGAKSLLLQLNKEVKTVILASRSDAYAAAIEAKTAATEAKTAASAVFEATSLKLSDYLAVNNGLIEDNTIEGLIKQTKIADLQRTLAEAEKQKEARRGEAEQAQEILKKTKVSDSKVDIDVPEVYAKFDDTIEGWIEQTKTLYLQRNLAEAEKQKDARREEAEQDLVQPLKKTTVENGNIDLNMEHFKTAISSGRDIISPGGAQTSAAFKYPSAFTTSSKKSADSQKRTIPESPFRKRIKAGEAFNEHTPVDNGTTKPLPATKHGRK